MPTTYVSACLQKIGGTVLLLIMLFAAYAPAVASPPTIIIGTQRDLSAQMAEALLKSAFEKLNINVEFTYYPHRRALVRANNGSIDGDLMRVKELQESFPNLLRVPVPVFYLQMFAFSKEDRPIQNSGDLQGLRIGIERGVLLSKRITEGLKVNTTNSLEHMVMLLDKGRIDVGIMGLTSGLKAVQQAGMEGIIKPVGQPLSITPLFFHVNRRFEWVIPKLSNVLEKMWDSGEADLIQKDCLRRFSK